MAGHKQNASKLHKLREQNKTDDTVKVKSKKAEVLSTAVLPEKKKNADIASLKSDGVIKKKVELKTTKAGDDGNNVKPRTGKKKPARGKKREKLNKRERRLLKLKSKKHADLIRQLLPLSEVFRREDTSKQKCFEIIEEVLSQSKDKLVDLCMAHDTARIIESAVQRGTEAQRWRIFAELKKAFRLLSKSRYAKFVVLKLIKYGDKEHRLEILKAFRNHFARLVNHRVAAEVVELLYNDYANASQRAQIMQELYGNVHALDVNEVAAHSLATVLKLNPDRRSLLLSNLCRLLTSLIKKGLTKHSIVQHLLLEYLQAAASPSPSSLLSPSSSAPKCPSGSEHAPMEVEGDQSLVDTQDMAEEEVEGDVGVGSGLTDLLEVLVDGHIVPMLHTREGVRAGLHAFRVCPAKLRKTLIRGMKTCVSGVARNEHGHLFLIGLLDSVDDVQLLSKYIIKEIREDLKLFVSHPEARKVLLYALSPRDRRHFSPQLQESIFSIFNDCPFTKKPLGVRAMELRSPSTAGLLPRLLQLAATEEGLLNTFIGPVGEGVLEPAGLEAMQDRGRIVLLTEMLLRSAPHHLDPTKVALMYTRPGGAASQTTTAPALSDAELRQLADLRLSVVKCLVTCALAVPFQPSQKSGQEDEQGGEVEKRSSVDRNTLRMKRHKQATIRADAAFSGTVKPSFPAFGSAAEETVNKANQNGAATGDSQPTAFLERAEGQLMLRHLLQDGHEHGDSTLSRVILELVPTSVMLSWTQCNRGCFFLVNLCELGDSALSTKLKRSLKKCIPQLKSSWHPGAKVLLKCIKDE